MIQAQGTGNVEQALANGNRLLDLDPSAAAEQAEAILKVQPVNGDALRLLGAALRRLERNEEAERAEMEAIRTSARHPILAEATQALGEDRREHAEDLLLPYLRAHPNDVFGIVMLAEIGYRIAAFAQAETFLRKALAMAPAYVEARLALAKVLMKQDRPVEAIATAHEVLRLNANNVDALKLKATALDQIGEYEKTIAVHELLLERDPDSREVWIGYGHRLRTVGRLEESIAAYRRAIEIDPNSGEAWWSLANLKTVRLGTEDITAIMTALAAGRLGEGDAQLHLALGTAYEDASRFEESFHHYAEGNRILRATLDYDPATVTDEIRRSKALFTASFFAARSGQGCPAPDPIFVLGMPRAGSTLIEQILASHSKVEGTSELPHIPALVRKLVGERWRGGDAPYPELLAELTAAQLRSLGEEYLERARAHRKTDRPFFVDKMPHNWMEIGLIHLILPKARIIDARRDPLACSFSNFKQYFSKGHPASFSLEEMGRYYRDYVTLLGHFDRVLPGRIHRVPYEEMIAEPEKKVRELLEHLGLPFEEACLRFYENERAIRTASSEQVRRPINRQGLDAWKPYDRWLSPLREALGPLVETYPEAPADAQ